MKNSSQFMKPDGLQDSVAKKYALALGSLHKGLSKKGSPKKYTKVLERMGRLKEKYARAAQDYEVIVTADEAQVNALLIEWKRVEKPNSQATHPGLSAELRSKCAEACAHV